MNEPQREVCWACFKRLSGEQRVAVHTVPVQQVEYLAPEEPLSGAIPAAIRKELNPGERLLWHGRPLDKIDLRNIPLIALPLTWVAGAGMIWIGGTLLHIFKASWTGNLITVPFGVIFLVAGIYVLLGPFLQRVLRRGTFYAITDRRVIVVHERPLHHVIARDVTAVSVVQIFSETFEGAGDIHIGFDVLTSANSDFQYIENVQEVAGILHLARSQAEAMPPGALADDAPLPVARIVVPLYYTVIGLYVLLVLNDTAEIIRSKGKILDYWKHNQDRGDLPPWTFFFAAPVMMYLFYVWAGRYKTGRRAARKIEVGMLVGFVLLGFVLLFWKGPFSAPKTIIYVVFSVFALILTTGRRT